MAVNISSKRVQIDKAKAVIVGAIAGAVFIIIFSLVASKALLSQRSYESKVTHEQTKARDQLIANVHATDQLVDAYKQFVDQPNNIIGGSSVLNNGSGRDQVTANGQSGNDGDNAKIVLDALPSKYDFPALQSSLEKMLSTQGFKIDDQSGTDDEIAQSANQSSDTPSPVELPFKFTVSGNVAALPALSDTLQRSIRPFVAQNISISGKNNEISFDFTGVTYYLPARQLNFPTEVVK
jgi:hypothetical protein